MASASLCGLTNVAADKRSDDCATLRAALLLTRLQLNLGVSQLRLTSYVRCDVELLCRAVSSLQFSLQALNATRSMLDRRQLIGCAGAELRHGNLYSVSDIGGFGQGP